MAKTLKERAREAADRLAKSSKAVGHAALLRAKGAGRGISTAASKGRASFCARTAAPPSPIVVKARVDRALRLAAPALGHTAADLAIRTDQDAADVARTLMLTMGRMRGSRLAREAYEAAQHWAWYTQDKDVNNLRDAADYAANVLDEVS